jgi:hypothetical protein
MARRFLKACNKNKNGAAQQRIASQITSSSLTLTSSLSAGGNPAAGGTFSLILALRGIKLVQLI